MLSVYKASAGSGKTYTLAREYIKLLLAEKNPITGRYHLSKERGRHRHTLAITFTNKATEEMKRRIIHELAVLAALEPGWTQKSPYEKDFIKEFECTPEELQGGARSALKSMLLEFDRFNVSTIDAFFQVVLRAFAREAELTGNYELELDNQAIINQAVGELLTSLRAPRNPAEARKLISWLTQLMLNSIDEGLSFNVFNRGSDVFSTLVKFINNISDEEYMKNQAEMEAYLKNPENLARFLQQVNAARDRLLSDAAQASKDALSYISNNGYEKEITYRFIDTLKGWSNPSPQKLPTIGKAAILFAETGQIQNNKRKGDIYFHTTDTELISKITRAVNMMYACTDNLPLFKTISKNAYMLGLLHRTMEIVNEIMTDDNRMMLSNTNFILQQIIGDSDAPFVYERIGSYIHHFLIDEFQDTSEMQWHNMKNLMEQGLAIGEDSLVIGDEKQCIYRFRNSDPSLLHTQIGHDFRGLCEERGKKPEENTNWRSSHDVVEFNNELFKKLSDELGFSDVYANVVQGIPEKNKAKGGYINISQCETKEDALDNMLDNIYRELESGYRPEQIAVLVRTSNDGAEVIDCLLRAHETEPGRPSLKVVSDDSMALTISPAVRLIVSQMRVLATADVAGGERGISRRVLANIINSFEQRLAAGKTRSEALAEVIERFDDFKAESNPEAESAAEPEPEESPAQQPTEACDLTSIVEEIIKRVISPEALVAENAFISTFQDFVLDFTRRGNSDLTAFLKWWDTSGSSVKVALPPDPEAIRVLTIHKSKGLEFECVHIPYASWLLFHPKSPKWFDLEGLPYVNAEDLPPLFPLVPTSSMEKTILKDQYLKMKNDSYLDELNVAYVAFTRAVTELIVGVPQSEKADPNRLSIRLETVIPFEDGVYIKGYPTHAGVEHEKPKPALEDFISAKMPSYTINDHADLWAKTRLEEDDELSEERRRGKELHDLLSKVTTLDDIAEFAPGQADAIMRLIENQGVKRWFEGMRYVLCEREIIGRDNKTIRPDRIVWLPDGSVEVIDYKTGENRDARYRKQVKSYVWALRGLGYKRVRGYIFYLDTRRIVEV